MPCIEICYITNAGLKPYFLFCGFKQTPLNYTYFCIFTVLSLIWSYCCGVYIIFNTYTMSWGLYIYEAQEIYPTMRFKTDAPQL